MKTILLTLLLLIGVTASANNNDVYVKAPLEQTFSASAAPFTPYATATDVCTITAGTTGSIGSSLKVYHVRVWGIQSTAGINNWFLIKRSAADTGGSSSAIAITPHDIHQPSPSATVLKITAAPTPGTSEGTVRGSAIAANLPAGTSNSSFDFAFGPDTGVQPIVLWPGETLALNFNGAAIPSGMSISCEFNWSEK